MKDIDWFEFFAPIVVLVFIFLFFFYLTNIGDKELELKKEIIKQSEEYTIYNECTEIQGKYYCK